MSVGKVRPRYTFATCARPALTQFHKHSGDITISLTTVHRTSGVTQLRVNQMQRAALMGFSFDSR